MLNKNDTIQIETMDALIYAGTKNNLDGVLDDPHHRFVETDICNKNRVIEFIEDVDVIVHFAAESYVDRSINHSGPYFSTNV